MLEAIYLAARDMPLILQSLGWALLIVGWFTLCGAIALLVGER